MTPSDSLSSFSTATAISEPPTATLLTPPASMLTSPPHPSDTSEAASFMMSARTV